MRILYVSMKHDYGNPEQGLSFEHCNLYDPLHNMGHEILYFDYMALMKARGRDWMNCRLVEAAKAEKPDLIFTVLHREELDKDAVREVSDLPDGVTLNWFCDDHWRFDDFSRHWAPCFNWVATTAASAVPKYERMGYANAVKTQWACNHFLYRPSPEPPEHDVTFIGMPHGTRRDVIARVRAAGIDVRTWGQGWDEGRLSQDRMVEAFGGSRINLNLSNSSRARNSLGRCLRRAVRSLFAGSPPPDADQIKGRNFEVPGCGGFLLTGRADNLGDYYDIGREIACFEGTDDLIDKVRHYLTHEDERAAIAKAGHERTLREHTYVHRFRDIFRRMGLASVPDDDLPGGLPRPGETQEVR
ncbi:MAG: CgeB family protein [Planctomycetota bacterium]